MGLEGKPIQFVAVSPHIAQEIMAALGRSRLQGETEEELELRGGEIDSLIVEIELEVVLVEAERAVCELDRAGTGTRAAKDGLYAEQELLRAERFFEEPIPVGRRPNWHRTGLPALRLQTLPSSLIYSRKGHPFIDLCRGFRGLDCFGRKTDLEARLLPWD